MVFFLGGGLYHEFLGPLDIIIPYKYGSLESLLHFVLVSCFGLEVLVIIHPQSFFFVAERLRHGFNDVLDVYGEGEVPVDEMVEKLMTNTVKDD